MALPEPHRQGRPGAHQAVALRHDDHCGDRRAARRRGHGPPSRTVICGCPTRSSMTACASWRRGGSLQVDDRVGEAARDGGPDGRASVLLRNVTEPLLFGVRGKLAHPSSGPVAGQHDRNPKTRAQSQTRRAVRVDHLMFPGPTSNCSPLPPGRWSAWASRRIPAWCPGPCPPGYRP